MVSPWDGLLGSQRSASSPLGPSAALRVLLPRVSTCPLPPPPHTGAFPPSDHRMCMLCLCCRELYMQPKVRPPREPTEVISFVSKHAGRTQKGGKFDPGQLSQIVTQQPNPPCWPGSWKLLCSHPVWDWSASLPCSITDGSVTFLASPYGVNSGKNDVRTNRVEGDWEIHPTSSGPVRVFARGSFL